jgi:hypothetical protein
VRITDSQNLGPGGVPSVWAPEIYLTPPGSAQIEKNDDLRTAWDKIKEGELYRYINSNSMDHGVWNDNPRNMILSVLKAVTT